MTRIISIVASLALVAVVGVGIAVADGGYGGSPGSGNQTQPAPQQAPSPQELRQSKVAFSAYLSGEAEVNDQGQNGAGDPDAKGSVTLLAADEDTLCYAVTLRGSKPPAMMHIHRAPVGQNGDVVIDLSKNVPKNANGQPAGNPGASSGCKTLQGTELAAFDRIRANPQNYYFNIHTPADGRFPKGLARGQLSFLLYNNG